jgi:hypothetical protein
MKVDFSLGRTHLVMGRRNTSTHPEKEANA